MEHRPRQQDAEESDSEAAQRVVTAHETCPGRTVFTEADNTDGWIATDLTVEPEP